MTERSTMRDVCVDFRERGRSYVADLTFIYHLQRMFETLRLWDFECHLWIFLNFHSCRLWDHSLKVISEPIFVFRFRGKYLQFVWSYFNTIFLRIFQYANALMGTHCWNILSKLFPVKMKRAAPNNLRQSRVAIVAIVASSRFLPFRNSMGQNVSRQQLLFRQHACSEH